MSSTSLSVGAILPLVLLSNLDAQAASTRVVPGANAKIEGSSASAFPYLFTSGRTQQIWTGTAVTSSIALISGISYRRDTNMSKTAVAARAYGNVKIQIGLTTVTPTTMSTTFAKNVTSSMTTVISGNYSIPAQPVPTVSPAPFNINMNWTSPFVFNNTGNLLLDTTLPGTIGKSEYSVDAEAVTTGPQGAVRAFGSPGAFSSPQFYSFKAPSVGLGPGGTVEISAGSFTNALTGTLVLGLSNTVWSGTRLPLDLKVIGAPKNNLLVSMDAQVPFNATLFGLVYRSSFKMPIPNKPVLKSLTFYAQAYYRDTLANSAGLVTTHGLRLTLGNGPSGTPVTNEVGHWIANSTTGFLFGPSAAGGPVVQFSGVFP